ncbi:hypothetical protein V7S43_010561 [Phytophthora oleae]|uniref:Uncharacterized protein n=1 Tax=Phytophthora oleae TaxID=2107226 RepID=A0ABD3FBH3_9STRA
MNDARLEGVAFEEYFHTLVRHRRPIRVKCRKYDNVNRSTNHSWKNIMHQKYVIDCSRRSSDESKVESTGTNMEQCVAVMEEWATNPSKMEYWIPATSLCETIDAVAKWTFPNKGECFCFLQLTMATKHKCDAGVLWELVQPFVKKNLEVCYIALIHDKDKIYEFQLDPVQITKREILDNVTLYVAHFEEEKQMAAIP